MLSASSANGCDIKSALASPRFAPIATIFSSPPVTVLKDDTAPISTVRYCRGTKQLSLTVKRPLERRRLRSIDTWIQNEVRKRVVSAKQSWNAVVPCNQPYTCFADNAKEHLRLRSLLLRLRRKLEYEPSNREIDHPL